MRWDKKKKNNRKEGQVEESDEGNDTRLRYQTVSSYLLDMMDLFHNSGLGQCHKSFCLGSKVILSNTSSSFMPLFLFASHFFCVCAISLAVSRSCCYCPFPLLSSETLPASQPVPQRIRAKHYQTCFSGTSYTSVPSALSCMHTETHMESPALLHTICHSGWQRCSLHRKLGGGLIRSGRLTPTQPLQSKQKHKDYVFHSKHARVLTCGETWHFNTYVQTQCDFQKV